MSDRLRLKALDGDDLSLIAACLQDALIPLSEMVYLAAENRFLAAFTRFRRECLSDPVACAGLTQCQSALVFHEVEAVRHHGLDSRFSGVKLELLTVVAEPSANGSIDITLVFAGAAAIRLQVRRIFATLEDFGEPWPAPVRPAHDLAVTPPDGR